MRNRFIDYISDLTFFFDLITLYDLFCCENRNENYDPKSNFIQYSLTVFPSKTFITVL